MKPGSRKSAQPRTCPECYSFVNDEQFKAITGDILTAVKTEHPNFGIVDRIRTVYLHTKLLVMFYHEQFHDIQLALEAIEMQVEHYDAAAASQAD